jgi:16S rRNA (guanine(966)-N(2))-methyltransferase RsmD
MRILTGKYKGRLIKIPKGIRPTQNKARKAIFDILGDVEGLSFLELFAGSGAVGFEAISRGAREIIFVEKERRCQEEIKKNLSVLNFLSSQILGLDALEAIKRLSYQGKKFDIVFLDPPYYQGLSKKTLQKLEAYDILAPYGFIIVQHFKKDCLPDSLGVLTLLKQPRYGDTVLSFYKKCAK